MSVITTLQAQANDPQRVNVFLDDMFALGVSLATLTSEGLYVGKHLDAAAVDRLRASEGADKAVQAGLRAIEQRARSSSEVRQILRRKEFSAEHIDAAIERLTELGLLNDDAYARRLVESRQAYQPRGKGALRQQLQRRGVDRDTISSVLADEELVGDAAEQVDAVARAALRRYADAPDRATFQRKLGGYLQRRGYGFETARPVLDALWAELRAEKESD